jgi:hypothetical protein
MRQIVNQILSTRQISREQEVLIQGALMQKHLGVEDLRVLEDLLEAMNRGSIQHWSNFGGNGL